MSGKVSLTSEEVFDLEIHSIPLLEAAFHMIDCIGSMPFKGIKITNLALGKERTRELTMEFPHFA